MIERQPGPLRWHDDAVVALTLFGLAVAVRLAFLAGLDTPPFDPWRHLALVRNLREGLGFTLFDGQPYLWYGPAWYYVCAWLPDWFRMEWVAGLLSAMASPLIYLVARRAGGTQVGPVVAGLLGAASGPLVAYTCHYGPEAAALALTLGGLLACAMGRRTASSLAGGACFGLALVLRMNFVFDAWMFLPWIRTRWRATSWAVGAAVPLALTWWRNHGIIRDHAWVFTWDGLATRSADFDALSTLVIQLHPAVGEGLRRLHERIIPWPEWIVAPGGGIAWGPLLFVVAGVVGLLACRRASVALAGASAMLYFLALDGSLSSNFFRIYLVVFPCFFLGIGFATERLWQSGRRRVAVALPLLALSAGLTMLDPVDAPRIDVVSPPERFLSRPSYLVNSGFYHPESLIFRFPGVRFLGLPIEAGQLDEFLAAYPDERTVLWHDFSVQDEVRETLSSGSRVQGVRTTRNVSGRLYEELRLD